MNATRDCQDYAWSQLSRSPVRRRLLGRERCDAIAAAAAAEIDRRQGDFRAAGPGGAAELAVIADVEQAVLDSFEERCGFAFMTLVVLWAISAITQILVVRWWTQPTNPDQEPKP